MSAKESDAPVRPDCNSSQILRTARPPLVPSPCAWLHTPYSTFCIWGGYGNTSLGAHQGKEVPRHTNMFRLRLVLRTHLSAAAMVYRMEVLARLRAGIFV